MAMHTQDTIDQLNRTRSTILFSRSQVDDGDICLKLDAQCELIEYLIVQLEADNIRAGVPND